MMTLAVYSAGVPTQAGFAEGVIEILTGKTGEKFIVTELEMAGFPVAHVTLE